MRIIKTPSLNTPYTRTVVIAVVASVLLLASLGLPLSRIFASDDNNGKVIRATGTQSVLAASPDIAQRTVGDLFIQDRINVVTWNGALSGKAVVHQTVAENTTSRETFITSYGTFFGTLGSSTPGSFSFINHVTSDRSITPIPAFTTFVAVEGTGQGGLAGICGGGTYTNIPASTYNFTFRFGEACNSAKP